jgi:hypothetical protein
MAVDLRPCRNGLSRNHEQRPELEGRSTKPNGPAAQRFASGSSVFETSKDEEELMHFAGWRVWRALTVFGAFAAVVGLGSLGHHALAKPGGRGSQIQVPTSPADFFQPGTQPVEDGDPFEPVITSNTCFVCHGEYLESDLPDPYQEPYDGWVSSLMAQSARDPVWHAALAIANQDANLAGEFCIRCHSPGAWLAGRSASGTTDEFIVEGVVDDWDGVNCHFCHRVVNPVLEPDSPDEDAAILAALQFPPGDERGNGRFVVDPADVRRGPYQDIAENPDMNLHGVEVIYSPVHRRSELCATCHDLANPVFLRLEDGSYVFSDPDSGQELGQPHATQDPWDMFPEQMTYSEWLHSDFANGGVAFPDGRFGGNHPTGVMEECQDCHMPDQIAGGCFAWEFGDPWFERQDLGHHSIVGGNTWALAAVLEFYGQQETGLTPESVAAQRERTNEMLRAASDTQVVQYGDTLRIRVINFTGHKLPTGYPEGRRMWLNVRFYDDQEGLLAEYGAYDYETSELTEDTKVYEAEHGIDETVADATNLEPGPSFHLALNNKIFFDNRIPPMGFSNDAFDQFASAPVGYEYEDGQHWDDSEFTIPEGAADAVVTLYFQTSSKEYMEFLRDANVTNGAGQTAYDLWDDPLVGGKSAPVDMDLIAAQIGAPKLGDLNGSGSVDVFDLLELLAAWGPCPPPTLCPADLDGSGSIDVFDLLALLANWG